MQDNPQAGDDPCRRAGFWNTGGMADPRFMTLADVAEVLNISPTQTYALVRNGELPALKIGGRGQWRVEASQLESYIGRMYAETAAFIAEHPLRRSDHDVLQT